MPELLAARQGVHDSIDAFHLTAMLHFDKAYIFESIYMCFYFQASICKHIMQWINTPASRKRKLHFKVLTYVSSSICCIKPSALFPYDLQELIRYIYLINPPKYMQMEWVYQVYFCVYKTAITLPCTYWPTLFHEWFCNNEAKRHDIFWRD